MVCAFAATLAEHGRRIALIDEDGTRVSYQELAERADVVGRAIGTTPRLVLLEASNTVHSIAALLGCLRGGHPVILTTDTARQRILDNYRPHVRLDAHGGLERLHDEHVPLHPDLALMLSTSGSTGATKLVRLSHAALQANAAAIAEYLHIADDDVAITSLPIGYSYGLSVVHSHLSRGAALILTDRSVVDEAFMALFAREHGTSIAGVPYTYELLEATGFRATAPDTLRTMTQAGGRLPPALVSTYHEWSRDRGVSFFTMYGQTEATARMAYLSPDLMAAHEDCIGRAIPGGTLRVAVSDDAAGAQDAAAPLGTVGELVYRGENVMMGYASDAADLARGHDLAELRTGDLGQEVESGIFRVVGRTSRFSKIAGLRVSLDELETVLKDAGIPATVAGDDELIVVAIADAARVAHAEEVIDARTGIPLRSRVVVAVPDLPRLPSGKVDYPALRDVGRAAVARADAAAAQASGAAGGSAIAPVYRRALNKAAVRPSDSFASLAGDSLAYIEVSMAIEQLLGSLPDRWEELRIEQIDTLAAARPATARTRHVRSVATEMMIRPLAMTMIVTGHVAAESGHEGSIWKGGALALMMTAGYNATRFQRDGMISPRRWRLIAQFMARFVLPYYLLILAKAVLPGEGRIAWSTPLLLDSYIHPAGAATFDRYWFLEALFHLLVLTAAAFSIPAVRGFAERHRWRFALAALAVATAFKFATPLLLSPAAQQLPHRLDAWAYAYALGFVAADAATRGRKLFALAAAFVLSGVDWGFGDLHNLFLTGATLLVLFVPRLPLWTPLAMFMAFFAQSTFYIYLSHGLTSRVVLRILGVGSVSLTVLSAVLVGMVGYLVWRRVEAAAVRVFHRRSDASRHRPSDL